MILQALAQYYDALAAKGALERPGWQPVRVTFALHLSPDGRLTDVTDLREDERRGKKTVPVPQTMNLPEPRKRASGIAANLLCDNATYFLGIDFAGKPERAQKCFEDSKAQHLLLLHDVDDPAARAVVAFFESWKPEAAAEHPCLQRWLKELGGTNLVFMVGGLYAHESPAVRQAWQQKYDSIGEHALIGRCLVTGEKGPIARLHPSIKGVQGAQSAGASLVSFNAPAFESYGHLADQGLNAPVSKSAAFAYGAALNALIADREHRLLIGDMTVVFWSEQAEDAYADLFEQMMGEGDKISDSDLRSMIAKLASGRTIEWREKQLDPSSRFYVLGLSPNAARLSVRFFLRDTFGAMAAHIDKFQREMEIVKPAFDEREQLSIRAALQETVNPNARDKNPASKLTGDMVRAVLNDARYPTTMLTQVQLRIRAEQKITRGKAAMLKAYLLRNLAATDLQMKEGLTVKLNDETTYAPYVLGRLFAVLEQLQRKANPDIGTTIRDRFFTSACATPSVAFPQLVKLAQAHLKKLNDANEIFFSKQLQKLIGDLHESYPARLDLNDQGVFQIGYYHQTQKFFETKEDK